MGKPKPSKKALGKRKAPPAPAGNAAKKAKGAKVSALDDERGQDRGGRPKRKPDQPKKVKLRDQKLIPVPRTDYASASDDELSDLGEDEELEIDAAAAFSKLDPTMLSRTRKETKRIHALEKERDEMPVARKKRAPSVSSISDISDYDFDSEVELSDEDRSDVDFGSEGGSDLGEEDDSDVSDQDGLNDEYDGLSDLSSDEEEEDVPRRKRRAKSEEAEYETTGRARWAKKEEEEADSVEVGRLPIKLPTGEVQLVEGTTRVALPPSKKPKKPEPESETEEEDESESEGSDDGRDAARMAAQPGRFGRLNIGDIVSAPWKNAQRLEAAKEQLAALGAEAMGGGELVDIAPTLTRLSTFALPSVAATDGEGSLPIPNSIRALAFLSQLAVFKDIIPGYSIRPLTAQEEAEKVRDEVRRQREGEKMLVRNYKSYLRMLEVEIKRKTPLSPVALKCMSDLLSSVPHFNFSSAIMATLVARLGRRSWDEQSDLILSTFVSVFKQDVSATYSQALVRLIARMIKERKFQVHPNVLSCLLHLRLRTELNQMQDGKKKKKGARRPAGPEKKYKSEVRKKWQTKNQRKKEKEMKEIEREMAEAEAEVDEEERAQVQTETLKNLFVLYFSILKFPGKSALLPAALEGLCHFTHLINIDFFRDLLQVLRKIIADGKAEEDEDLDPVGQTQRVRIRMLGIVTAFDLLSGQGEALNIDLGDFVNELYALLRPLALDTGVEDPPLLTAATAAAAAQQKKAGAARATSERQPAHTLSTSDLLFRCLEAIFFPRWGRTPPLRAAAFGKRLCECALTFPPATARETLAFVRRLASKEPKLANLLDTEERTFDGVYRPEIDDPQLANPFTSSLYELETLAQRHWEHKVRAEAKRVRDAQFV
ncbi:nucleolar complex-associated protein 3 [Cutaneotrichosporon oleaginosum]|uniref:Nucleolar complex-associated protein 3 n=1 Tax=Cutaneotrichosporon oleaginosum TaxID=879819 RepID=A0A0J0XXX0_9TREE|nr:nucleolar complex-associated protein 3 [Cutaneotrichosporon oleaginosum]KLT45887.1 nucleolar complex-associated protein 3 [Cutaneotrichosporon oleaginosum]TXT06588.1 hypothetical protein COLE_05919 [Cutaneotrichosporon oleaginosum]